ncbi:MAG: hypothetical protein WBX15_05230 [Thermoanaerobaculia bacterium]
MSSADDATAVAVRVARSLERAGIEYAVGGSVAASAHGEPRATRDLDFAIRLTPQLIPAFLNALGPDFSADEASFRQAIRTGRAVNVFYLPFFTKIDFFVRGDADYDRAEFSRRIQIEIAPGEQIFASSAEDNLLWKLRWYRMGNEVSEQQWRDVLGLIRVSGARMDEEYLRRWAIRHGIGDLLERALRQSESP